MMMGLGEGPVDGQYWIMVIVVIVSGRGRYGISKQIKSIFVLCHQSFWQQVLAIMN